MKLFSFFKSPIIEFLCISDDLGVIPEPTPAGKHIPDWYKAIKPKAEGHRDHFGGPALTAKKCMPMVDAMTLGFIIPLFGDVNIRTNKTGALIESSKNPLGDVVQFHDISQLGGKTSPTYPGPAIKFINRWVIKTAPGWSSLFIPPVNHLDPRFTCLSGLVETDNYPKQVNFPAVWHLPEYDGVIKAGTPLVTIIPIFRGTMPTDAINRSLNESESAEITRIERCQNSRAGYYTNELRGKDVAI